MGARKAITRSGTASSAYAIDNPRISFCSSILVAAVSPLAQRLQQRLFAAVDVDDGAASVDRDADGGTLGTGAFQHPAAVLEHLHGRFQLLALLRSRYRFAS